MSVTDLSQRDSRCDFGVSHTTPTRPDPTRPLYRWLAFHHDVALVTRAWVNGMMQGAIR